MSRSVFADKRSVSVPKKPTCREEGKRLRGSGVFPRGDEALLAPAAQIAPTSRWFAVPLQLRQQIAPTEDFELARSLVDTEVPEDDLFAGVRETINA